MPSKYATLARDDQRGWTRHVAWGPDGEVVEDLTWGYGPVPERSPYRAGQWVTRHGYPGGPMPSDRRWWRGMVLGYLGGTSLVGITDTGQPWAECWGSLSPDRTPNRSAAQCTCCPPPRPRPARPAQLDLLALLDEAEDGPCVALSRSTHAATVRPRTDKGA